MMKEVEAKPKRREWTQASAMHWMSEVAEGREHHGLQACSAFSFLIGTGSVKIAHVLMAGIHGRIDRERREAEAKT